MKKFLLFILFGACNFAFGQNWVLDKQLLLNDSSNAWTSDEWGQLYQWKGNTLWLQPNLVKTPVQETFKNLGEITTVQPYNGLRSLVFSESQQMLGLLDNALHINDEWLAMYDYDFSNITSVAVSIRPEFVWIFDQYRERLRLFNIHTAQSVQMVDNCFGDHHEAKIVQFFEYEQNLHCVLEDGQYFVFDRNLTLIKNTHLLGPTKIYGIQNRIWQLKDGYLQTLDDLSFMAKIELPKTYFEQMQILQDRLYLQKGTKIEVYRLKM